MTCALPDCPEADAAAAGAAAGPERVARPPQPALIRAASAAAAAANSSAILAKPRTLPIRATGLSRSRRSQLSTLRSLQHPASGGTGGPVFKLKIEQTTGATAPRASRGR